MMRKYQLSLGFRYNLDMIRIWCKFTSKTKLWQDKA